MRNDGLTMRSAFRFRLYPTSAQEARMLNTLEASRRLWNDALAHRKTRWEKEHMSTSYNLQASIFTLARNEGTSFAGLYSQTGQDVLRRLDKAFKAFFERRAHYPRFKMRSSSGSFTYPQSYNGSVKPDIVRRRLYLSKVGNVPIVFHRSIPKDSRMKTCTITREPDGKWFASMVFEEVVPLQNIELTMPYQRPKTPIGVDLGLLSLVTTSDGDQVPHPHFLRKSERRLKHLQRIISHKKKGSKNRFKVRQRVASQHSKVRRQRLDFNQKISTELVRRHSFIAFEDLRVKNMVRNHKLAKSIQDAGWDQLVRLTEYKALKAGSRVVKVDPGYTSQECYHCGAINKISLDVREFVCVGCDRALQRDVNAAQVVLKRGLALAGTAASVGRDTPDFKPVETRPLLVATTRRASQVAEAGTIRREGWKPTVFSRGRMSHEIYRNFDTDD
jgi:putative transposase